MSGQDLQTEKLCRAIIRAVGNGSAGRCPFCAAYDPGREEPHEEYCAVLAAQAILAGEEPVQDWLESWDDEDGSEKWGKYE